MSSRRIRRTSSWALVLRWKDGVRHWKSLEGHAERVHALFEALPSSALVLDDYVRFLYNLGEQSLPQAFISIANRLSAGEPARLLSRRNTVFLLESLLRRYVYGRPLEMKKQADLRDSVLKLLDVLYSRQRIGGSLSHAGRFRHTPRCRMSMGLTASFHR